LTQHQVAVVRSRRQDYGRDSGVAQRAVRDLLADWGLDRARIGSPQWNPLGELITPGARVVLKPNWVLHYNQSGQGLECLVTHPTIIEAVLEYVALARPGSVVLGDAPLQSCDFDALSQTCGLEQLVGRFERRGLEIRLVDFRRTVLEGRRLGDARTENRRDAAYFVLFDLKHESLLEDLAGDSEKFRVTMYNPDLLQRTHRPGRHQYLIAREVIDADVVINLPKLKTHKKSCITGAIKNLVGINGNKEYLPHHRKGGGAGGGDCYEGRSWLKERVEDLMDMANRQSSGLWQTTLSGSAEILARCAHRLGADENLEGSWYGNDTIWRTCLDLQRILMYGRPEGTLSATPQRRVVTITDAIIGGEGEGPLASTPVPSGFVTGALNPVAAEWVHARLMGFEPRRIPIINRCFDSFSCPLVRFEPSQIQMLFEGRLYSETEISPFDGRAFQTPRGWQGHCESEITYDSPSGEPTLVA